MTFVTYRITGTSPLLQHNPAGMQLPPPVAANGRPIPRTGLEEAEINAYRAEDGTIYHPSVAFRSALLEAAKGSNIIVPGSKRPIAAKAIVSGSVSLVDERTPLLDPDSGARLTAFVLDTQRVVIQRNAILRSRPKYVSWGAILGFEINEGFIEGLAVIDGFMTRAGQLIGIGDFRPQRNGIYGRFSAQRE
jgi:hypothetical protein